jgi:hypothetical protein
MRLLPRLRVGAFLLVTALVPRPGAAADAAHPLDPAAPAGVVPTQNMFEDLVPLLDRDSPVPSFAGEAADASPSADEEAAPPEDTPMDQGGMDHGAMGHGAPPAEASE